MFAISFVVLFVVLLMLSYYYIEWIKLRKNVQVFIDS